MGWAAHLSFRQQRPRRATIAHWQRALTASTAALREHIQSEHYSCPSDGNNRRTVGGSLATRPHRRYGVATAGVGWHTIGSRPPLLLSFCSSFPPVSLRGCHSDGNTTAITALIAFIAASMVWRRHKVSWAAAILRCCTPSPPHVTLRRASRSRWLGCRRHAPSQVAFIAASAGGVGTQGGRCSSCSSPPPPSLPASAGAPALWIAHSQNALNAAWAVWRKHESAR